MTADLVDLADEHIGQVVLVLSYFLKQVHSQLLKDGKGLRRRSTVRWPIPVT